MKERTKKILAALIREFVTTGSPVASKKLLESGEFSVSSATVRNEFAVLEEVGLIESPHVSAGKVPTSKGYRFFVEDMVNGEDLDMVRTQISAKIKDYQLQKVKESLFDGLRVMSQLSGNIGFAMVEADRTMYIGLGNVLRAPEFVESPEEAAQVVEMLEGNDQFRDFIRAIDFSDRKIKVFIGEENLIGGLQTCAMLVTPFAGKGSSGFMGILGPTRMRYRYNTILLEQMVEMI